MNKHNNFYIDYAIDYAKQSPENTEIVLEILGLKEHIEEQTWSNFCVELKRNLDDILHKLNESKPQSNKWIFEHRWNDKSMLEDNHKELNCPLVLKRENWPFQTGVSLNLLNKTKTTIEWGFRAPPSPEALKQYKPPENVKCLEEEIRSKLEAKFCQSGVTRSNWWPAMEDLIDAAQRKGYQAPPTDSNYCKKWLFFNAYVHDWLNARDAMNQSFIDYASLADEVMET